MGWDYIIVGAGSAGCAVAYELVKAGRTVLLLEAGGSDGSPFIKMPAGGWYFRPEHDWGYRSQPDPSRNGAIDNWRRGRVLGGSSSINGMVYVRGAAGDFDRWAQHCGHAGGWSGTEVMAILREIESSDQLSPLRGRKGPLHVRTVKHPHRVTEAFVESACAAGYAFNSDYNGASQEGVGYLQLTQRGRLRCSAADAFLAPIRKNGNLKLRLHTTVDKIEIENERAVAVVCRRNGKTYREAARDIILCAGTTNSPKLLMLSGIGDAEELRRHKIDVALDLPAVGGHLKEHARIGLDYRTRVPSYNLTEGVLQKIDIAMKYVAFGEGPLGQPYEAAAFLKTVPLAPLPDVQVFFAPIGWDSANGVLRLSSFPALKIAILRSHSISSGRITLTSNDPAAPPRIESRLLDSAADVDTLALGIEAVRSIMRTRPIESLIEEEIKPGAAIEGAQAVRGYVRSHAITTCHPIGTCRMGVGAETVVSPDLRVHGMKNLWIADASIMPDHISANINAACIMIGTKLGKQLAART